MDRTALALLNAPFASTDGSLRVELHWQPAEDGKDGVRLSTLHREASFADARESAARVFRAQVGAGDLTLPIAVKLQRDDPRPGEDSVAAVARFDIARAIHRRIQGGVAPGELERRSVVRELECWDAAAVGAPRLPPCILCPNARHALALHCPSCHAELQADDFVTEEKDRRLFCPDCLQSFHDRQDVRRSLLGASVQRDAACAGCAERTGDVETCTKRADFLNYFPSRILFFELLDGTLDDYLRWRPGGEDPKGQLFDEQRRLSAESVLARPLIRSGAMNEALCELIETVALFGKIADGLGGLHAEGIAHLNLKPSHIGLRLRGTAGFAGCDVKLLDLGTADDPLAPGHLKQARSASAAPETHPFTAPEAVTPSCRFEGLDAKWDGKEFELIFPGSLELFDPAVCPGDRLLLNYGSLRQSYLTVVSVERSEERMRVRATVPPETAESPDFFAAGTAIRTDVFVQKCQGEPADIFSLGMVLLALLMKGARPDDVIPFQEFRDELPNLQRVLNARAPTTKDAGPPRGPVRALAAHTNRFIDRYFRYQKRLANFGVGRAFADDLMGIVLRATVRGIFPGVYARHRGDVENTEGGLPALKRDLEHVRNDLLAAISSRQTAWLVWNERQVFTQWLGRIRLKAEIAPGSSALESATPADEKALYRVLFMTIGSELACDEDLKQWTDFFRAKPSLLKELVAALRKVERGMVELGGLEQRLDGMLRQGAEDGRSPAQKLMDWWETRK